MSADEVLVFSRLWGQQQAPFPFRTNPGERSTSEVERAHREIAQKFETHPPRHFSEWARTSIAPDIRVESELAPTDPSEASVRINAVRRAQFGFVAVQHRPQADGRSGDIDVYETPAERLADGVVAALPACRAGTLGDLRADARNTPATADRSWAGDEQKRSWDKLAADHVTDSGFVQVREGRYSEWRLDQAAIHLFWTQYETYGRYVSAGEGMVSGTQSQLVAEINRRIAVIVRRVREARGLV